MEYSTENITDDVVKFTATFDKNDYAKDLKQKIKSYALKAKIPGFRKGKLPSMMIHKIKPRFFQEVITEKVDDLFKQYQKSANRKILLGPIFSNGEFVYLGHESDQIVTAELLVYFQPLFELNLETLNNLVKTKRMVGQKLIDKEINRIRTKFRQILPNKRDQEDGETHYEFLILDKEGKKLQKPLKLSADFLRGRNQLALVKQYNVGDKLKLPIKKILGNDFEKWNEDYNNLLKETQEVELSKMEVIVYPEFNHHLVHKEFPYLEEVTDKNYMEVFKKELQKQYSKSDDVAFYREIINHLIEKKPFSIDNQQFSKFLSINNEIKKSYTDEQIHQMEEHERNMCVKQLIEQQIFNQEKLEIDNKMENTAYYQSLYQLSVLQGFDFFRLNAMNRKAAEDWIEKNKNEIQYRTNKLLLETTIFNHLIGKYKFKEVVRESD